MRLARISETRAGLRRQDGRKDDGDEHAKEPRGPVSGRKRGFCLCRAGLEEQSEKRIETRKDEALRRLCPSSQERHDGAGYVYADASRRPALFSLAPYFAPAIRAGVTGGSRQCQYCDSLLGLGALWKEQPVYG